MRRICLAFLLVALLSGCAGLAVGTYGKKELASTNFALAQGRNHLSFIGRDSPYSREEIVSLWGEPDNTSKYRECEVLVYKDKTSWAGAGAFVGIIPVPLVVPTGKYKNRIYLRNNASIGLIQEYGDAKRAVGYTCGSNECEASLGERTNEPEVHAKDAVEQWCKESSRE